MNPYTMDILLAWAVAGVLVLGFVAGLIGLRWLWRRASVSADRAVAALETRVAELEAERGQLADLAERLDFAERLLAQQAEIDKLAGGR